MKFMTGGIFIINSKWVPEIPYLNDDNFRRSETQRAIPELWGPTRPDSMRSQTLLDLKPRGIKYHRSKTPHPIVKKPTSV
jgi:hypothetical protein